MTEIDASRILNYDLFILITKEVSVSPLAWIMATTYAAAQRDHCCNLPLSFAIRWGATSHTETQRAMMKNFIEAKAREQCWERRLSRIGIFSGVCCLIFIFVGMRLTELHPAIVMAAYAGMLCVSLGLVGLVMFSRDLNARLHRSLHVLYDHGLLEVVSTVNHREPRRVQCMKNLSAL